MPVRKSSGNKKESSSKLHSLLVRISNINIVYILGFLLIVASFLIGVLITKVNYLENGEQTDIAGSPSDETGARVPRGPVDVSVGQLPTLGNSDAKVTLVEFSDFQCPFCERMFTESFPQLKKDFIDTGKIKFAYRHYPLTSIHPNAQKAAEASECANAQGNFWDYHDQLFQNQADWEGLETAAALDKFVEYATAIGIDGEKLRSCVSEGTMAENVSKDVSDGNSAGVSGTPATFVNGVIIEGAVPYSEFKAAIEKALAEN